jgi:dTDP-4-amino-4,6-dideoxygalactose transaminase
MLMEPIPFHKPLIGAEEEEAVLRVLRSGWLTTGKEALLFEEEFRDFLTRDIPTKGADKSTDTEAPESGAAQNKPALFCLAVNSATSGLHLALEALGVGPGDAVFVPSYTFTATAEVVRYLGAEAVFVDIAPDSFNISAQTLEAAILRFKNSTRAREGSGGSPGGLKPKAVIPVHIGGLPCDMEAINSAAKKHGLAVVEDAAHAFPAKTLDGRWAGTRGDVGVFSFYATKTITTGEGGMVVTPREDLARHIAIMRSHGIDRSVWNRYTDNAASWYYEVVAPGFKYNLPDLLAAVGRVQLRRAADMETMREAIAARYDAAFQNSPGLIIPPAGGSRHLYALRLRAPEKRDALIASLRARGIGTSVHYIPLHIMPYYRERYGLNADDYPESLRRFNETLSLPIWPGMTEKHIDRVIDAIQKGETH